MIISHRKSFVIFSPWKTASSTINVRLLAYNECPYSGFYDFNPHLNRVVHQHLTCAEFAALPESRLGYFGASFVRNPYDRVYSGFQQLQKDLLMQPKATYPQDWIRDLVMGQLIKNFEQLCKAQFDFDRWFALVDDHQVFEVGQNTSFPLHPAHYWTHVAGRQTVEFIGRVENFETDFDALCGRLNLDGVGRTNANVDHDHDPGADAAPPSGYRYPGRMSRRSIDKINRLFDADFALFGYDRI